MKLSDTQFVILSAASQREDGGVELPSNLKGGAAQKVVAKLLGEGLLEEERRTRRASSAVLDLRTKGVDASLEYFQADVSQLAFPVLTDFNRRRCTCRFIAHRRK